MFCCTSPQEKNDAQKKTSVESPGRKTVTMKNVLPGQDTAGLRKILLKELEKHAIGFSDESDIITMRYDFEYKGKRIIAFTYEGYFDYKNAIFLLDSARNILDTYIFSTVDSGCHVLDEPTYAEDAFNLIKNKNSISLDYELYYTNQAGKKYIDSIEDDYWKNLPDKARPNENRYGFKDAPVQFVDTVFQLKEIRVVDDKFVVK